MVEPNGTEAHYALLPPSRLYERLAQINGYTWDQTIQPFHSTYDNWHVFGIRHLATAASESSSFQDVAKTNSTSSPRSSPHLGPRPFLKHARTGSVGTNSQIVAKSEGEITYVPVVARVSIHTLRIEREYHIARSFIQLSDPESLHTIRPIALVTLPARQADDRDLIVSIVEAPGRNYLKDLLDLGPAWLGPRRVDDNGIDVPSEFSDDKTRVSLSSFLDFAIGACECLELMHHGLSTVHGELRPDAFHFNRDTGSVRLINFGSGPRSFEEALTSRWSSLAKEVGIKYKLQYVAPEQTGRMPAEPNSRTDIYGLGIVFWTLLTGKPPYTGETPIDIVQAVVSRRIPSVSSERLDVPDAVSKIIQKMTQKQMDDRYHSMSGVKYDLLEVQRLLGEGDDEALSSIKPGSKDVPSFFILPAISGREEDRDKIVAVIERMAKWQEKSSTDRARLALRPFGAASGSTQSDRLDALETATRSSDASSLPESSKIIPQRNSQDFSQIRNSSNETVERPSLEVNDSRESVETTFSVDTQETQRSSRRLDVSNGHLNEPSQNSAQRGSHKLLKRCHCELISITGTAGVGKSSLIQSTQPNIRRLGYFASTKFDAARSAPYEPLLKAAASLFRQIFSESDINTAYHLKVRSQIKGLWPSVQHMLDLPESLIQSETPYNSKGGPSAKTYSVSQSTKADLADSNSTRSSQTCDTTAKSHYPSDFLRGGANVRSLKFAHIFVEVLRILATNKLICLCLDDLHFADEESLDLISLLISKKLGLVILTTCREKGAVAASVENILSHKAANITAISLLPLSEREVIDYVAATLYRSADYVMPLAIVCMEKTGGNPFYLRQMLEVCHRKGCIWYSWRESVWEFDIDRIFAEFQSDSGNQKLDTSFITNRLQNLPSAARSILAWASLLGNTFSFALIQRLLTGEFDYNAGSESSCTDVVELLSPQPVEHVVEGLQACLAAYVLVPGNTEDDFSFSHDRYMQASSSLRECQDVEKMHFIIVQTMLKCSDLDVSLYTKARHICQAANVIEQRVSHRYRFRALLCEAAEKAVASGARPTALQFYVTCLSLLQPNPWKEGAADVFYEETLDLLVKAATIFWHQGELEDAQNLLDSTFSGARTASDKAPAWTLQSRLFAQAGNMVGSFTALRTSLLELGLDLPAEPTWEACDTKFDELRIRLRSTTFERIVSKPLDTDPKHIAVGPVMIEAISAAFWTDSLLFYQLLNTMIEYSLDCSGNVSQIGLGYAYWAIVCISRDKDMALGLHAQAICRGILKQHGDSYLRGRELTLSTLFISHFFSPIRNDFDTLEESIDHSLVSGDKHLQLLNTASIALYRLYIGDHMADIELFCIVQGEDLGDWETDLRGGVFLIATRQVAKALQGKTWHAAPDTVMSDGEHNTAEYMALIASRSSSIEVPRATYNCLQLIPLYLYGHYGKVIQLCAEMSMHHLWTMRLTRLPSFYGALALIANLREHPTDQDREKILTTVKEDRSRIMQCQLESNINYLMWLLLIDAELAELEGHYGQAIQYYEAAIDHTELHDFLLEQALAYELQGDFFIRRGAKRSARATLKDALVIYARIGATGKVDQLNVKHEWILRASNSVQMRDQACQTANTIGEIGNTQLRIEENERQETRNLGKETAGDRIQAWVIPTPEGHQDSQDISDTGLDVLDLQSILEFNQAISSELQIDRLLAQMTQIVLESAGAQADFAGVVIEAEHGWSVAASGNADGISTAALLVSEMADEAQKQVLLYTIRFRETVFVHSLALDERFLSHGSAKAVISLPIFQGKDLLGVLYLEGQPNAFTDRNLVILQLFCNQVGISIANAFAIKRLAKVSASNVSMIQSQKLALGKAREAENKAKVAEAEAMENVRLKEEAAKVKSIFLANVSHELRTPLNGVIGMADLLKTTPLNDEQKGMTNSIHVCADALLTAVNDILDFSKLEAGKMQLFSKPLNLKDNITEVVRALSHTNNPNQLKTIQELNLDPELLVMGDAVRLHQIFMNLLSNSYKFTAKGSVTVRAKADFEDRESIRVSCAVADTGIGITQEQVSRLFQPFSQADSSTQRSYGGSGLGLSICKALVEVMHGRISLESQVGTGTTVSFTLTFRKAGKSAAAGDSPIATREPDPMATWSSDAENVASRASIQSTFDLSKVPRDQLRICVAEDNPINQKIAVSFVNKLGFQSEAYSDGLQAVEALRRKSKEKNPFHLVLMDVQMPVMDGYDATQLIRRDEDPAVRGVLIIAMTASAIRGDREKCLHAGMNNYLAKPVRAAVLKEMLETYLREPIRPVSGMNGKATATAQETLNPGTPKTSNHHPRPSFEKRMSSRNAIPFSTKEKEASARLAPKEQDEDVMTPKPAQYRPSIGSKTNSSSTVAGRIEEDEAVPPLSLADVNTGKNGV